MRVLTSVLFALAMTTAVPLARAQEFGSGGLERSDRSPERSTPRLERPSLPAHSAEVPSASAMPRRDGGEEQRREHLRQGLREMLQRSRQRTHAADGHRRPAAL